MKFIENNMYTLQTDYYNSVKVVCTYIEDNTVWLSTAVQGTLSQACPTGHQPRQETWALVPSCRDSSFLR